MCGPAALAAAAVVPQAASQILGFMGQGQAYKANEQAANLGYANTENQIGERNAEIDQQQSENTVEAVIKRVTAQGRISASASSMGSDAATAGAQENQADFVAGRGLAIENINSENQRLADANASTNAFYERQSQISKVAKPNSLGLILGLAGTALSGASTYGKLGGTFGGTSADSSSGGLDLTKLAASIPAA